jgi:hypothetical protein
MRQSHSGSFANSNLPNANTNRMAGINNAATNNIMELVGHYRDLMVLILQLFIA